MTSRFEFCTVVDEAYLPRLVVLHRSLAENCPRFTLRVVCMDDSSADLVHRLGLRDVAVIPLGELEADDDALAKAKPHRTFRAYCWTLKASLLIRTLRRERVDAVAYVDADQMLWSSPSPLYEVLGTGNALVVPQGTLDDRMGRFNAGLVLVRNTPPALEMLGWWRERCLERCEESLDEAPGDQAYLDEWPSRFPGVRVFPDVRASLAPWNTALHRLETRGGRVLVDGAALVLFHHQSFRLLGGLLPLARLRLLPPRYRVQGRPVPFVWSIGRWYELTDRDRRLLWEPYAQRFSEAVAAIRRAAPSYEPRTVRMSRAAVGSELLRNLTVRPARSTVAALRKPAARHG